MSQQVKSSFVSEDERPQIMSTYSKKLSRLGLLATELEQHLADMRALQSKRAGVPGQQLLKWRVVAIYCNIALPWHESEKLPSVFLSWFRMHILLNCCLVLR